MRPLLAALLLLAAWSCAGGDGPPAAPPAAQSPATSAPQSRAQAAFPRLEIRATQFVRAGAPFEWRGITAFRLAELIAHGREAEAVAYLDWARAQRLTVVRVLTMATHLFQLRYNEGLEALSRLLQLARDRGLYVEVVVFADTSALSLDWPAIVKNVADIAAVRQNAVIEIANEPWHPTQDRLLHDPAAVARLAALVPPEIPVALGAIEGHDGYASSGRYATWHSPRSSADDGWGHVLALADGAALPLKWKKPIVSDEPIGAADAYQPGRRDNEPRRFAAAAVMTRLTGLGATFHYEGGLQARIPSGKELECLTAWSSGLDALAALPPGGEFKRAPDLAQVIDVAGARAMYGRVYSTQAWIAAIDPGTSLQVRTGEGWREEERRQLPGVTVVRLAR